MQGEEAQVLYVHPFVPSGALVGLYKTLQVEIEPSESEQVAVKALVVPAVIVTLPAGERLQVGGLLGGAPQSSSVEHSFRDELQPDIPELLQFVPSQILHGAGVGPPPLQPLELQQLPLLH
ncbi:hypothetical protein A3C98_05110 [Candidatus Roizmanbacteria bacterium RIFCSPHIGHO2_02_FULL_37_15]|nr:MAG: hypothetical protein A2859_06040 [Candidatus Roizmanbacteria bacterium RIFCSPHIGHO2_01_FULL_37_16b]OGK20868.1 MAG: hypothetical protein A3C98_05110 [Candidatus Roizmanbacteria bacterium RIFCSPHIGHO2_02_FULL_37_15]